MKIGDVYGRWTIIERAGYNKWGGQVYLCRCSCGTLRKALIYNIRVGRSKSCGCYQRERASIANLGQNSVNWVGDKITYPSLHVWIRKHKPKPDLCERCKNRPPRDLSNNSGQYKRDINDYEWLCRSCHFLKDGSNKGKNRKLSKHQAHRIREFSHVGIKEKELVRLFHVNRRTVGRVINKEGAYATG